jgi:hypothetical protein
MKKIINFTLLGILIFYTGNCLPVEFTETAVCGDSVCDASEDSSSCSSDCAPAGWYEPTSTSSIVQGGCQWFDGSGYPEDYCMTNYYEGSCALIPNYYGGVTLFSTNSGSTSLDTINNICVDLGYTGCTAYNASGVDYLLCGPDSIASASIGNLLDLVRTANDDLMLQRSK